RQRVDATLCDRGEHQVGKSCQKSPFRLLRLCGEEDEERLGVGVDPAESAGCAPMAEGAWTEQVAEVGGMGRPVQTPAESPWTAAALLLRTRRHCGELIACHGSHRRRAEDTCSSQRAAAQYHLAKAGKIARRGD